MRKLFFLFGLIVPFLQADPIITTSVSCQSYGAPTITGVSSCAEGGPVIPNAAGPSYASASASATVALQQAATDWLTVSFKASVNAVDGAPYLYQHGQLPDNQTSAPAFAGAAVNVHIDFYTPGEVRPGILQVEWSPLWMSNSGDFVPAAGYTIKDSLQKVEMLGSCVAASANCSGPGPNAPPIAFELGSAFTFDSFATLSTSTMDGNSSGYDGMLLKFRFFEADGVTPVLSYDPPAEVPEPRNLAALGLLGLLGIVWFGEHYGYDRLPRHDL